MILYLLTGIVIIVLNILFSKKTKYSFIPPLIIFIILFSICIFRNFTVGTDYNYYLDMFNTIGKNAISSPKVQLLLLKKEYGWYYMNKFFYVHGTFFLYIFCFYFIMYFLVFKAVLQKSSMPLLSLLLYFFCGYFFVSLNVMRQALVFSFFLYSIRYIESKKFWKYLTILAVISLFHISGLFLIPLYFIKNFVWSKTFLIILVILSLLLGYSNFFLKLVPYIHFERLKNYLPQLHRDISFYGYLIFAINSVIAIVFLFFTKDINSINTIYLKLVVFGIILSNLVMHFLWLFRFSDVYFAPIMIIGYTNVISESKNVNNRFVLTSALLLYSFIIFYLALTSNSNGIVPYSTIF
jgi:transmembrane protein EpsG